MPAAEPPFTADVIAAVKKHMNEDHAEHSLAIVRTIGGRPDATGALVSDVDPAGAVFTAQLPAGPLEVRVPWTVPITERRHFREQFVEMYERSLDA